MKRKYAEGKPVTIGADDPVEEILRTMTEHGVRRLPVIDGHDLVGELAVPEDRPPVATMICLHPLPTHGGFMDSHLLKKASYRLPALAGISLLVYGLIWDSRS
mgnify:CR=1 FL=1